MNNTVEFYKSLRGKCQICDATTFKYFVCQDQKYRLCSTCGLITLQSIHFNLKSRKDLYNKAYWLNHHDDFERNNPLNTNRWMRVLRRNKSKTKYNLEFGCGRGFLMKNIQNMGMIIFGVDMNPPDFVVVDDNLIERTSRLDYMPSVYFDSVMLIETIQHLFNPLFYFMEFRRILVDYGRMLITTSLSDKWVDRDHAWFYFSPPYHVNMYALGTLEILAERACFKIIDNESESIIFEAQPINDNFTKQYELMKSLLFYL
jgi:SAM-dependent methyltransferase